MTRSPEIVKLELGTFRFPEPDLAHRQGVVMGYAIRHRGGIFLFDTGLGFGNKELDERYHPVANRIGDALAAAGIEIADVTAVANCHLHADHAGQNATFRGIPIYAQPAEREAARGPDYTIEAWVDGPGVEYRLLAGDYELLPGLRILATPGHSPGHQSLVVDTAEGPTILAGQAAYSAGEWAGREGAREGRSSARDQAAYDRSVARLKDLDPVRVWFGHDRETWVRPA
jgi:N-acyl homoserine lactone hydrolase